MAKKKPRRIQLRTPKGKERTIRFPPNTDDATVEKLYSKITALVIMAWASHASRPPR